MISTCFRHQHPEEFGRPEVSVPWLPDLVRYGRDEPGVVASAAAIPEEAMGNPASSG
jgi:hypothetical protein